MQWRVGPTVMFVFIKESLIVSQRQAPVQQQRTVWNKYIYSSVALHAEVCNNNVSTEHQNQKLSTHEKHINSGLCG